MSNKKAKIFWGVDEKQEKVLAGIWVIQNRRKVIILYSALIKWQDRWHVIYFYTNKDHYLKEKGGPDT